MNENLPKYHVICFLHILFSLYLLPLWMFFVIGHTLVLVLYYSSSRNVNKGPDIHAVCLKVLGEGATW